MNIKIRLYFNFDVRGHGKFHIDTGFNASNLKN